MVVVDPGDAARRHRVGLRYVPFLKPYVLRAAEWGFEGTVQILVGVGRNAFNQVNTVEILFEPAS